MEQVTLGKLECPLVVHTYVIRASGATNVLSVDQNGDTTISGHLEAQRLTINKPSHDDVIPLKIINSSQNWEVVSLESTIAGDGCLMRWMTPASSTHWWSGVWGATVNDFNVWFNYKGLSIKPTGDVAISGDLDVGVGAASSIAKAHVNHEGSTGSLQLEARWRNQSFVSFDTTYVNGYVSFEIENDYYM